MAATELYIPTMTRAKSDTLVGSFNNYCLAGLDSNPDTYEQATIVGPTIRIDMDYTGAAIGTLNFAGIWMGPALAGWSGGTMTVYSGSSYPGILRGSVNYGSITTAQRLMIVSDFADVTDRYWSLVFSGFSNVPSVREVFIGRKLSLNYRWDWESPMWRRDMADVEELAGGRIISTLQRQNQSKGMVRNYELLPQGEWAMMDLAYRLAHGRHGMFIVADDGTTAITGGVVMRFASERFEYRPVAHQLWAASMALQEVPVIADGDVF